MKRTLSEEPTIWQLTASAVGPETIVGVSDRLHLRFFLRRRSPRCDGPAFSEERERPCSGCYCRDCGAGMRSRLGDFDNLLVSVHDGGRCPAATADPV